MKIMIKKNWGSKEFQPWKKMNPKFAYFECVGGGERKSAGNKELSKEELGRDICRMSPSYAMFSSNMFNSKGNAAAK